MRPWVFDHTVHRWCTFGALFFENVADEAEKADKTPRKWAENTWKYAKKACHSRVRIVAKIPESAWLCGFSGFFYLVYFFKTLRTGAEIWGIWRIIWISLTSLEDYFCMPLRNSNASKTVEKVSHFWHNHLFRSSLSSVVGKPFAVRLYNTTFAFCIALSECLAICVIAS